MALIHVIYDTKKDEFSFKDDEDLTPAESIAFIVGLSKGAIAPHMIEYLHKTKDKEFLAKLNEIADDMAVQRALGLKAMPLIHPLKAWDNVPKGTF